MADDTPERKQINFTIVPDEQSSEPRTYANFCSIAHTPFDFTLTFCEVMPLSDKELREAESDHVVRAPVRARVVVPVQFVPNLVAAGAPIEAVAGSETIAVPETLAGKRDAYVLRVKGDSMIDEQIRDGDLVIVEDRKTADNGEMVIALIGGVDVTLKKFYRENGRVRLQPANATMQPILVDSDDVQIQGVVVGVIRKY